MTQAYIYFSGIIQGVGFRYTVHQCVTSLGLTGWVQNLADGRVEAHIEGKKQTIEEVCEQVKARFEGSVTDVEMSFKDAEPEFGEFTIRI